MTRRQHKWRLLTRRCIKAPTFEERATFRKYPGPSHWKYAPIHRRRLYKIAHPLRKDSIRSTIFSRHVSISLPRMGTWNQRYPVTILFGLLQWPGLITNYEMREPFGCVIRKVRP